MPADHETYRSVARRRSFIGIFSIAAIGLGCYLYRDSLSLDQAVRVEQSVLARRDAKPVLTWVLFFLVYFLVAAFSIPGAALLTILAGWFFGLGWGVLGVSFASTLGATVAFLASRYFFRAGLEGYFGERKEKFHRHWQEHGKSYLFALRLVPVVPFFVINLLMGMLPIRVFTFAWVSQLGMLPGTALYVYAGSALPSLGTLQQEGWGGVFSFRILIAFSLLAAAPFVFKALTRRWAQALDEHAD